MRQLKIEPHVVDGRVHLCVHARQDDTFEFALNGAGLALKAVFKKSPFDTTPGQKEYVFGTGDEHTIVFSGPGQYPFDVVDQNNLKMAQGQIDIDNP